MLTRVMDMVREQGWFPTVQPFQKTILLSQGAPQAVLLTRCGVPGTFVKFTERDSLRVEAERLALANAQVPEHTAVLLGHARRDRLDALATRALDYRPIDPSMYGDVWLQRALETFLCRMRERASPAPHAVGRHALVEALRSHDAAGAHRTTLGQALQRCGALLEALPSVPQHCDFTANNLGLLPTGVLVAFDWEDFGLVDVPGLDLFTLEFSTSQDGVPPVPTGPLCAASGLTPEHYRRLRLLHALIFRYLKRTYGAGVRARLESTIDRIAAETAAPRSDV